MKKQIILITILLSGMCYAQKIKFAVKGGLNLSNARFSVIQNGQELDRAFFGHDSYNNRTAFYLGGSVEFLLNPDNDKTLSIQLELLYSRQGYDNQYEYTYAFELDKINLPII